MGKIINNRIGFLVVILALSAFVISCEESFKAAQDSGLVDKAKDKFGSKDAPQGGNCRYYSGIWSTEYTCSVEEEDSTNLIVKKPIASSSELVNLYKIKNALGTNLDAISYYNDAGSLNGYSEKIEITGAYNSVWCYRILDVNSTNYQLDGFKVTFTNIGNNIVDNISPTGSCDLAKPLPSTNY